MEELKKAINELLEGSSLGEKAKLPIREISINVVFRVDTFSPSETVTLKRDHL